MLLRKLLAYLVLLNVLRGKIGRWTIQLAQYAEHPDYQDTLDLIAGGVPGAALTSEAIHWFITDFGVKHHDPHTLQTIEDNRKSLLASVLAYKESVS